MFTCMYLHICILTSVHAHAYVHKHAYTDVGTYVHIYIYICMYVCIYTGDQGIHTDIVAALLDKADRFNIRDITVINDMILEHHQAKPVGGPTTSAAEIDVDKFALAMKQAQYDISVYTVGDGVRLSGDNQLDVYYDPSIWHNETCNVI